jgi:PAS domain S-box-containing protein
MFIIVKFIVIFFFRTAYEPDFMFQLTPFYLLSGLNNLHLLFLSLFIVILESYLHLNSTKKNLTYSFLPTIIMLSGCGYAITTKEMNISNLSYYIVFICLILALLIDHRHTLIFEDVEPTFVEKTKKVKKAPARPVVTSQPPSAPRPSLFGSFASFRKNLRKPTIDGRVKEVKDMAVEQPKPVKVLYKQPVQPVQTVVSVSQKPSIYDGFSNEEVTKLWSMLNDLERRTSRLERLEGEIDERRNGLLKREKDLREQLLFSNYKKYGIKGPISASDDDAAMFLKKTRSSAAIIQRGMFKQMNKSFAKLLGYEIDELVNKNMYNFIVPEGFSNIEKYYLHRLRGKAYSSYETIFLTKDNQKISVEIDIKPTMFDGEKAEIAIIKKSKDKNKKLD